MMAQKRKRQSPELSSTRDGFSFIAPHPLEICHKRLLSLRHLSWFYPKVSVFLEPVDDEKFTFKIVKMRNRGRKTVIYGEISAQTEQTTLVNSYLERNLNYWATTILVGIVWVLWSVVIVVNIHKGGLYVILLCHALFGLAAIVSGLFIEVRVLKRFTKQFHDTLSAPPTFDELGIQPSDGDVY